MGPDAVNQSRQPTGYALTARRLLAPAIVLFVLLLGCSAADLVERQRETPTVEPTVVLVPTFTPSPVPIQTILVVTPPADGNPGVIIVPPGTDPNVVLPILPTNTPAALSPLPTGSAGVVVSTPGTVELVPTATPPPTFTPTPSPTPSPTPTATPFVLVTGGLAALRMGPGAEYPLVAQLGPNIPVAIVGKNEDGTWLQICCISGAPQWVATQHVTINNDISAVPVLPAEPPPPPTVTPFPTETPTETPTPTATPFPFELAIGPQFFPSNNEFLTIWGKLYVGTPPTEEAAPGYYLTVEFEGIPRPNSAGDQPSMDHFEFSAPPGSGSRVVYNVKYEYRPPDPSSVDPSGQLTPLELLGTGTWKVYVSDGVGNQLSPEVTFTTSPFNPNREIYVGWVRVR